MYVIIDIETTGGNSQTDRITEIAIYKHDGERIVDEFVSLINPQKRIPYNIVELTGITTAMLKDQPKFYEVAKQIVEITEGSTFVAHNVNFDYNFIRNEFKSLGYDFDRKRLCTKKLSQKLLPQMPGYGLGKLCRELGIKNERAHRAWGDAKATVQLFEILLEKDGNHFQRKSKAEQRALQSLREAGRDDLLKDLPKTTGVYYLYNAKDELIYIGKALNIRSRVTNHFGNDKTERAIRMKSEIARIDYKETGSELIALLLESEEIKTNQPWYNRAQRKTDYTKALYAHLELDGYIHLSLGKNNPAKHPITTYSSKDDARNHLVLYNEEYELCMKFTSLHPAAGACFNYSIEKCRGACIGEESPEDYNKRVNELINRLKYEHENFLAIDTGRTPEEKSLVLVEEGIYKGFGFIATTDLNTDLETMKSAITQLSNNGEVQSIIRGHLRRKGVERLVNW